jgi:hypothetical protein
MAASIEIEAGLREAMWPDVSIDYRLNGLPGEGRRRLAFFASRRQVSRRVGAPYPEDLR